MQLKMFAKMTIYTSMNSRFCLKRDRRKSSDAYIRKDNNLFVIEAKGFSVLVDCMSKNEKIENNNEKLFIKPVLQADERLNEIFETKEEFKGIENAFIISITLDNINAVPNYYNKIHEEIEEKKKCELVHYYFNFNIEEYEMLLFLIENGVDIFQVMQEYFLERNLSPFSNYVMERFPNVNMTKFMEKNYKAATDKMKKMLL